MISFALLNCFCGFYLYYTTSNKVQAPHPKRIGQWGKRRTETAKGLGLLLFFISCALVVIEFGLGAGVFVFFVFLMTLASLVVLLNPMRLLNYKLLAGIFVLSLLTEVFMS